MTRHILTALCLLTFAGCGLSRADRETEVHVQRLGDYEEAQETLHKLIRAEERQAALNEINRSLLSMYHANEPARKKVTQGELDDGLVAQADLQRRIAEQRRRVAAAKAAITK